MKLGGDKDEDVGYFCSGLGLLYHSILYLVYILSSILYLNSIFRLMRPQIARFCYFKVFELEVTLDSHIYTFSQKA